MKVLMVCLGNICRSPLAQGILENKVEQNGLGWHVDSAGTSAWHLGERPDSRSIEIATLNGIDISNQKARQFESDDFDNFDLILAMDSTNYRTILSMARNEDDINSVKMIMNYLFPGQNRQVPDPYYDGSFQSVYDLLDVTIERLIKIEDGQK